MWKSIEHSDFKSVENIKALQETALQNHIRYVFANSPYYKKLFTHNKINPDSIKSLSDLAQIPLTSKHDLSKYNNDFLCVPKQEIAEYVTTSGTLGTPTTIALTHSDLKRLAYNEKRSLEIAGITKEDTIQITTTLDKMFMAGMAYYSGSVALGSTVIRSGISNPLPQWNAIKTFDPTVTIIVPSFLYKLANFGLANNIALNKTSLKKAICIGEAIRKSDFTPNKLHQKISAKWNIQLYSTYASTEMMTAFTECDARVGGHQLSELIITEILNEDGNPVLEGELGEITVTPLGVTGMPVLRYKTGDLARPYMQKCSCGRNTLRLGPIEVRKNQMIKLKGTTVFPQSIEQAIHAFDEVNQYVIELSKSTIDTDHIRIYVADSIDSKLIKKLKTHIKDTIKVTLEITKIAKKELSAMVHPEGARKPIKIIDLRVTTNHEQN